MDTLPQPNDPGPGVGHNRPPTDHTAVWEERQARTNDLVETANVWLAECEAITSEGQAERATDLLTLLRKGHKSNEAARTDQTKPLRDQVELVNGRFKTLGSMLTIAGDGIKSLLKPWIEQKEADRQAKERAEREAAARLEREAEEQRRAATTIQAQVAAEEATEAAKAASDQADITARATVGVKGEVAQRATGLRGQWKATKITDLEAALEHYSTKPEVQDLLLRLASADARRGRRRIPGFKVEKIRSLG